MKTSMKTTKKKILDRLKKPNIVLIISDQQTWNPNYDQGFKKPRKYFPAMKKLIKNSMVFQNAHCNAATCTPSRTTLFTGTYPAYHGAKQVLAFDDPKNEQDPPKGYTQIQQGVLQNNFQNMFRMVESTNYQTAYKGKWHITKPTQYVDNGKKGKLAFNQLYWTPEDVSVLKDLYMVNDWTYPDAGDDGHLFNFGGGDVNNDGRFIDGKGQSGKYGYDIPFKERRKASTLNYIKNVDTNNGKNPFFLVVSLVNPHDVLSYPGDGSMIKGGEKRPLYKAAGYKDEDFMDLKVKLPKTWNDSLKTKPKVQKSWRKLCQAVGPVKYGDKKTANNYVKFYAHLTSVVDQEINKVLKALEKYGHDENTLIIRISDHGDMAMAHGRQRQKMYNVYQQTINVPMIFSHPEFEGSHSTESFSGLIDLMPTIADIVGADTKGYDMQGKSLVDILDNPKKEVQDYVHFTFDDNYAVAAKPWTMGAAHIRCIKKKEKDGTIWKYAVYFDPDYGQQMEYEMYNLTQDPDECDNLAFKKTQPKTINGKQRQRLHNLLTEVMLEKGTMPDGVLWPEISGGR